MLVCSLFSEFLHSVGYGDLDSDPPSLGFPAGISHAASQGVIQAARAIIAAANKEQPLNDPGLQWVGIDAELLRELARALSKVPV